MSAGYRIAEPSGKVIILQADSKEKAMEAVQKV